MLASRVKSFKSLLLKKKFGRKARGLKSAPMVCQAESQSTGEGVFFPPYVEVKQTPLAHSSSFSRPIGTLEKLFEDISEVGGGPIDREHTAFFTVLQVRFPPVVTRAEDHIARAWEEVGRQFPALRASISSSNRPDGNKQSMITVQPWSESNFRNSFTVHPGCPNVDVLFSTPSPRRTTATCHWLPDPGQVVIRTAHWRTDGFGLVLLSQTFLSTLATTLRAGISAPLSNNSASQPLSVPPSLEDLVRKHVQDHPGTAADADDLANIFVDGGRSIGFPTRPGASTAAPTVCERVAIRMDAGNSAKLVSACRTLGFSVTSAVNAAVIRTAARFPQEPGADAYVVFAPVDLRAPLMAAGAQECSQPTGNYVSGLPLRVDGVAKPSESGDSVPGKRFGELVHELGSIYSQDVTSYRRPDKADAKTLNLLQLSEPYIQRMAGLYSKFPAPGCPFPKTPVISSFGNMDTFIKQEYRSSSVVDDDDAMLAATKLNVTDFWVGCDCARPMIVFNPYSWGGEFTLLAAWDHSYYSKEFVLDVLEKTMAELYEGLEMGQTPNVVVRRSIQLPWVNSFNSDD
ncbi:hypothetical protein SLS62_003131 [Diatrype stigma]|uniref:Uncharacterized protein n=1 Tax=Diatrype stigma TaxID=117547 RepID=A0AAN9YU81_9PEZI